MLIDLFERFRLQTNVAKNMAVVCQLGTFAERKYTAAYGQRINCKGDSHCVRQSRRVVCENCGA